MQIPLALRAPAPGRLTYGIPLWFRIAMGLLLALVVASLALSGGRPGVVAWIVLALLAFGGLYEESWLFDGERERIVHRAGLLGLARASVILLDSVDRFVIMPHVEGTVPGTTEEREENRVALQGGRQDDPKARRSRHKKPFLGLVIECGDGTRFLVDRVPARDGAGFRQQCARMAELCGKPLVDAEP